MHRKKEEKILVVDDDPVVRDILSNILQLNDFAVEVAENGVDALEKYCENPGIELIISDMNMPEMSGLELIKELRTTKVDIPIIILTGSNEITTAINALNSGASDYLFKDENIQETLLPSVKKVLEKQKLKKQNEKLLADLTIANDELTNLKNKLEDIVDKLTDVGTALSSETNIEKLLETVVSEARSITNADAGTLYILEDEQLHFKIIQNKSMNFFMGGASKNKVTLPPVPLKESNASAYSALKKEIINIPDVYKSKKFDFSGPRKYDSDTGYLTKSMLIIPMVSRDKDVIGILQLINALHPKSGQVIDFSEYYQDIAHSLASQAAVAITNAKLYDEIMALFESVIEVLAAALDEKSPVTRGHISKVALLTMAVADEINNSREGHFKDIHFSKDELNELRVAALMHDVGKVTTPESVVEKRTKLETIFDRIELIKTRFQYIRNGLIVEALKKKVQALEKGESRESIKTVDQALEKQLKELGEDLLFVKGVNNPEEFMDSKKLEELKDVASKKVLIDGKEVSLITEDEFQNLSIRKGSITPKELKIMQNHASVTIRMLNKIPFTKRLKNVPVYAGGHHEKLDGSGYPAGLKDKQIPLQTRIIALTDLFEALTAKDRPYKKPIPLEKALAILGFEVKDNHIDKNLYELFKERKIYDKI